MDSGLKVFDDQSSGYERYVREHWSELEDWERDQYTKFARWAVDRKRVKAFITPPELPGARPAFAGELVVDSRQSPRLVVLAYALALLGVIFFPFILESAAVLLALVNMICRRWEHAILQLGIAFFVLALAELGHSSAPVVEPFVRHLIGS